MLKYKYVIDNNQIFNNHNSILESDTQCMKNNSLS